MLDDHERRTTFDALAAVAGSIRAAGVIPYPNPMALPAPAEE